MVTADYSPKFKKLLEKVNDGLIKLKIRKQIAKIIEMPEIGKPMKYSRLGTREVYIPPFRLSYVYLKEENKIIFLDFYHKDKQ